MQNAVQKKRDPDLYDFLYKILIVGDDSVGKSSLLARFADDTFTDTYIATIGVDFKFKTIEVDGKRFKLQIWDTSGQERFMSITRSYYRGSTGFIIMYDITKKETFDRITNHLEAIDSYASSGHQKMIIGNKKDLESKREVDYQMAMNKVFDPSEDIPFVEVSAKDGSEVEQAFITLVREIFSRNDNSSSTGNAQPSKIATVKEETDRGVTGAYDDNSSAVDYQKLEEESMANKIYQGRSSYRKIMSMKREDLKKYLKSKQKLVERFSDIGSLAMDKEEDLRTLAVMVNSLDIVG